MNSGVVLYTTHCPKCVILEKKLNSSGMSYTSVDDVDVMMSKGFISSPVLEVNGSTMDFAKAVAWVNSNTAKD